MQTVPRTAPDIHSPTHTPSPLHPPLLAPLRPPFPAALTEKLAADTGRRLSEVTDRAGWTEPRLPEGLVNTPPAPSLPLEILQNFREGDSGVRGWWGPPAGHTALRAPSPRESSCRHYLISQTLASRSPVWGERDSLLPSLLPASHPCVDPGGHQYSKEQRGHPNAHEGKRVSPDPLPAAPQRVPLSRSWFLMLGVWGVGWPLGLSSTTSGLEICGFGSSSSLCPGLCVHLSSVSTWSSPPHVCSPPHHVSIVLLRTRTYIHFSLRDPSVGLAFV